MDILSFAFGLLTGVLIFGLAYFILRTPGKDKDAESKQLNDLHDLQIEHSRLKAEKESVLNENKALKEKNEQMNNRILELSQELASKNELIRFLNEKIDNQAKDIQDIHKQLQTDFKNLANEILEEKTKKFTEQNSSRLNEILNPFKEQITGFEKRVEDTYQKSLKDQTDLQAELKKLQDLNLRISQEATNLTKALKGDVKKQGNWGEMILDKVLERSGLTKGVEYMTQESLISDEGQRLQPDVVVHLPDDKHILIDAKVSLVAWEKYTSAESPEEQVIYLKQHLDSVKKHVKELAEKNYQHIRGIQSPDFVLLFIPVEGSFSVAVKEDPGLFNEAWSKHIVIVSPTTLLATLMTVSSIWKQENQTRNALKIADEGAKLYDKFVGFLTDLEKIGEKLTATSNHYDDAMKKLKTGKGNLIGKVEGLKQLGIRSKQKEKSIPESLKDFDTDDDG